MITLSTGFVSMNTYSLFVGHAAWVHEGICNRQSAQEAWKVITIMILFG